jgi:hypothetical protein
MWTQIKKMLGEQQTLTISTLLHLWIWSVIARNDKVKLGAMCAVYRV